MTSMSIGHHGITGPGARLGGLATLAFALLLLPAGAAADTFTVSSSVDPGVDGCDATECTLREAITAANDNSQADTITFDAKLYGANLFLVSRELPIETDPANLAIDGDLDDDGTPDVLVFPPSPFGRVFSVASGTEATLEGLVITGGGSNTNRGGIHNDGSLTVTNSTISDNNSNNPGGGGIHNDGSLTVTNSTISDNSAADGGGIDKNTGTVTVKSTIVAGNAGDCDGDVTSDGFNLDGDGSCGFETTVADVADVLVTDAVTNDPLLTDNGGPTQTIALLDSDTNPAIDAIATVSASGPEW